MGSWALWNVGVAGLVGAGGVALAAVAAHRVADPSLSTAAFFLIMHATAAIAVSAYAGGAPWPTALLAAASLMLLAVILFSGDVASRVLLGDRLFPMAAPLGGSLLIISWAMTGLIAFIGAVRGS